MSLPPDEEFTHSKLRFEIASLLIAPGKGYSSKVVPMVVPRWRVYGVLELWNAKWERGKPRPTRPNTCSFDSTMTVAIIFNWFVVASSTPFVSVPYTGQISFNNSADETGSDRLCDRAGASKLTLRTFPRFA